MNCMGTPQGGNRNSELFLAPSMHRAEMNAAAASDGEEVVATAENFGPYPLETESILGRLTALHAAAHLAAAVHEHPVYLIHYPNENTCKLTSEWSGANRMAAVRKQ